jgi:hypothetical protein
MGPGLGRLVCALPLLIQGCILDIAPARAPLDEMWTARMLTGEYGVWSDGRGVPPSGPDEVRSSPLGAYVTRYGIGVIAQSTLGGGGWSMVGGMIGRVERPGTSVELFGKEVARTHGMKRTSGEQDQNYEFFLVVRPSATGVGRLVKQWRFADEEERAKEKYVHGYLEVDPGSKAATIAITGLKKPFQERVDLSGELP